MALDIVLRESKNDCVSDINLYNKMKIFVFTVTALIYLITMFELHM